MGQVANQKTTAKRVYFDGYPVGSYDYPDRLHWRETRAIKREDLAELFGIPVAILIRHETTQRPLDHSLIAKIKGLDTVWVRK